MRPQPDTKNWKPETMFKQKEWRKQSCLGPGHRTFDPDVWCLFNVGDPANAVALTGREPPYRPGEIVYIQEPFVCVAGGPFLILAPHTMIVYQANLAEQHMIGTSPGDIPVYNADEPETWVWRSPVLMPEKLSRSWARITDIWVEQIRDIGFDDIRNEGFPAHDSNCLVAEREVFERYWNSLYPGSWERNDFIWRYGLERVEVEK
jgi:hypothetical protein